MVLRLITFHIPRYMNTWLHNLLSIVSYHKRRRRICWPENALFFLLVSSPLSPIYKHQVLGYKGELEEEIPPSLNQPFRHQYPAITSIISFIQKDEQHARRQEIEGKERMACSSSWFRGWRWWISEICHSDFIPISPSFQAPFRKSSWSLWLPHLRSTKGAVFRRWFSPSTVEDWKGVESSQPQPF